MSRRGRRGLTEERVCAVEGCEKRAKRGSIHCFVHGQSAVGQAVRRELRDLLHELEKLESGRYPVLFSAELQELEEERRRNAELGVELGGLRLSLHRALLEIEVPSEMARVIVRVSEESRKIRGGEGRR